MAEVTIAGVLRAGVYSPNNIGNDTAIFNAVAEYLRKRGFLVNIYSEDQFMAQEITEPVILNMCREPKSVEKLQRLEDEGRLVINSGYGIANGSRERMTRLLLAAGIPHPASIIVNTDESVIAAYTKAGFTTGWIKRGDGSAQHKEDVSFVRNANDAQSLLQEYFRRGIKRAVINQHLQGDLIKFYGVLGQPFFFWFYPMEIGHSKYGNEQINGDAHGLEFDHEALRQMCNLAAEELGMLIYGGDCIVDTEGNVKIIDFNDWPSFAPCRDEAAQHIGKCVIDMIKERNLIK